MVIIFGNCFGCLHAIIHFDFGSSTEPHKLIKHFAYHILVDPIGDGTGEVARDRKESDPKRGGLRDAG